MSPYIYENRNTVAFYSLSWIALALSSIGMLLSRRIIKCTAVATLFFVRTRRRFPNIAELYEAVLQRSPGKKEQANLYS